MIPKHFPKLLDLVLVAAPRFEPLDLASQPFHHGGLLLGHRDERGELRVVRLSLH